MRSFFRWSSKSAALLALGVTASAVTPIVISARASAQPTDPNPITPTTPTTPTPATSTPTTPTPTPGAAATFPDVPPDYWAQPFIQALAASNVITGFPDGTFRPDQPVDRAEFAAMIQKAFNQNPIRNISAAAFTDVPPDYWAVSAIEEAYETGFLSGYPGGFFLPNQEIPKVQAIVALANGLGLTTSGAAADIINTYYTDAAQIPDYAVDDVAAATQANVVVNYPNVTALNPLTPLSRAEAAALLYQALVRLGQTQPLPSTVAATNYIVARTTGGDQNALNAQTSTATTPSTGGNLNTQDAQTAPTTTPTNIVALAASNNSFTTLTSALQATGLAESLQRRGPFTVFAPTDQAFAALPEGTLDRLLQPENRETLTRILMYHLVRGEYSANELKNGRARTVEGRRLNVRVDRDNNQITVNDASVLQPDIQATNGVIHGIDQVLLPPNVNLSELRQ